LTTIPPPDPDPHPPTAFDPPSGACDAHCHVFGPAERFPFAPERRYTPPDAGVDELARLHARLGLDRAVIVQASCHGRDHAALLDALRRGGGRYAGVAMIGDLFPQQIAPTFPLRAVIVPSVVGGTSRLRRISGGAALRALAPTTLFQLPGSGAEAFAHVADVVRRLPAWSLELGDDRAEIPRLVARAIEDSR